MHYIAEWRDHFETAAANALRIFWATNKDYETKEGRADYIKKALDKLAFVYRDVVRDDDGNILVHSTFPPIYFSILIFLQSRKGAYKSQLVLATFASHLRDIASVPDFATSCNPRGALLLSVVAVC